MNDLTKPILEEIKDLITEGEFNSRWVLIETYHKVGQIILENNLNTATVADYIGKSERTVEYMIKFASRYKSVDSLPEGKNVSWHKVIKDHLTTPQEKAEHIHDFKMRCWCGSTQ